MDSIAKRRKMRSDGLLVRLTRVIADKVADFLFRRSLFSPNQVSFISLLLVIGSGVCASMGEYFYLIISAILFYIGFIFDCVDGELARLKGIDSDSGQWLDVTLGELGNIIFKVGCGIGLYRQTGDVNSIWLLVLFLFLKYLYANITINSQVQVGGYENFKKLATDPLHHKITDMLSFYYKLKHYFYKSSLSANGDKANSYVSDKKIPSIGLFIIIPIILLLFNQLALILWFFILFYGMLYLVLIWQIFISYKRL